MSKKSTPKYQLSDKDLNRLQELEDQTKHISTHFLGYQANLKYDYSKLNRFFKYSLNNIGDPWADSMYQINTREFEREVLSFFFRLYHLRKSEAWGYVTNGGTEGNLYGLYLSREKYPEGVVYFSEDTHYSAMKTVKLLGMKNTMIKSQSNGEIDYADLEEMIYEQKDRPVIILANIGSTVKGAIDDIEKIIQIIKKLGIKNYYIHSDAALGGMLLPFLRGAPVFDFRLAIDSISVSGHKLIGGPIPCGVVIAKQENIKKIESSVDYVGIKDTTITGSRNGHTPLILWQAIRSIKSAGFRQITRDAIQMAEYTLQELKKINYPAWINQYSLMVVLRKPQPKIIKKWNLSVSGELAHIITMPHVTKKMIDDFISDLRDSEK